MKFAYEDEYFEIVFYNHQKQTKSSQYPVPNKLVSQHFFLKSYYTKRHYLRCHSSGSHNIDTHSCIKFYTNLERLN